MNYNITEIEKLAKNKNQENKKFFQKLKKRTPKRLDVIVQDIHEKEFNKTDCLSCGNCCKTTSPIFTMKDMERISKFLKMKVSDFKNQYLRVDSDEFHVLKTSPCSFLDESDNKCFIYDVRPKACSEYPHTDRKKFIQISDLTIKNTEVCPATFRIVEELKNRLAKDMVKKNK